MWSLCSVVFLAFTLKLPIQTSLSVAPGFLYVQVKNVENFRKINTSQGGLQIRGLLTGRVCRTPIFTATAAVGAHPTGSCFQLFWQLGRDFLYNF